LRGDHDVPDTEVVQGAVDALLAVATVGGGGPWLAPGARDDPFDGRGELRRVGRVALLQVVVQHDAVLVVDDLSLVAELDRLTELALGDRAGVRVVQADPAGRPAGVVPATRCRVWAATRRVTSSSSVRSFTARRSRPRRRPAAASLPPAAASASAFA